MRHALMILLFMLVPAIASLASAQVSSDAVCKITPGGATNTTPTDRYLAELGKGDFAVPFGVLTRTPEQLPDAVKSVLSCQAVENGEMALELVGRYRRDGQAPHILAKHIVDTCGIRVAMRALLTWPEDQLPNDNFGFEGPKGPCAGVSDDNAESPICTVVSKQRIELADTFYEEDRENPIYKIDFKPGDRPSLAYDKVNSATVLKLEPGGIRKLLGEQADIVCVGGIVEEPLVKKKDEFKPGIVLAKNLSGLRQDSKYQINKRDKSSYAELSASLDNEDREEIKNDDGTVIERRPTEKVSFNGAVGMPFYFENVTPLGPTDLLFTPYVELEYKEREEAAKETDNLFIGAEMAFALDDGGWRGPRLYPRFKIAFVTDIEERDSEQYLASFDINIPFAERLADTSIPIINSYSEDKRLFKINDLNLTLGWDVDAIIDHSEVKDAGDKARLFDYTRVGYNANGVVRLFSDPLGGDLPGDNDWSIELEVDYQFRDVISGDAINSDFIEVGLSYKPASDKNFSYGLTYKRGENTTSLEDVENWELGFKIRR